MNSDMRFYWTLLLRRLPVMATIFIVFSVVGIGLSLTLPSRYEASARLLVESAQIPDELAASTVRTAATEQLQIIEQRLLTRANLIDIANQFGIFAQTRRLSPDEVVQQMRELTSISTFSGRDRATFMTISFDANNPDLAAGVVNQFVTLVLNQDSVRRQGLAEQTLDFFEQEVVRLGQELDSRSAAIVAFKEQNQDALPENLDFRVRRQSNLQDQVIAATRERASLSEQRNRLMALGSVQQGASVQISPAQQTLNAAEAELEQALTVYSDTNPRIRVLRARIAQLAAAVEAERGGEAPSDGPSTARVIFDLQMAEIDQRSTNIDAQIERAEAEIERLRIAIERTPEIAIRLDALERDYQNALSQYNLAVANQAKAQTGERIEVLSKGERISVIEQATPPSEPSSPNRPLIAGGGVALGLAFAVAFFLLLELTNRTIRRPGDLVSGLTIQPLATIPYLETAAGRTRRRAMQIGMIGSLVGGVSFVLWAVHVYYLPLDLLARNLMNSLGL
jgi:polysaccharide chain length determinant protein (PEP-CTERM system associated)